MSPQKVDPNSEPPEKPSDQRFPNPQSGHRAPDPSDYGFPAHPATRFLQGTSNNHARESAAQDYGYNNVANSQQLPYYPPHKDERDETKPSAFDRGLKKFDKLKPASNKKELVEIIEALPDGVLRPVYRAAAGILQEPMMGGACGRDRLKANPPNVRWAERAGTEDSGLDALEFVKKYYGEFLDGTTTRRDLEEVDLRLVRAFRGLPIELQESVELPVGRGADTKLQDHLLDQIARGENGPIPFERLQKLVYAKVKRLQR